MQGIHLIADLYDCRKNTPCLMQADALEALCLQAIDDAGLTRLSSHFHQFEPNGATGVVILAESHLAVHTWPETSHVTLDVFVCNHTRDNSQRAHHVYHAMEAAFAPAHKNLTILKRTGISSPASASTTTARKQQSVV
jgi:spermidine synthase